MFRSIPIIGTFVFLLCSCGSRELKSGIPASQAFPAQFQEIRNRILQPRCGVCHETMLSHKKLLEEFVVPNQPEASSLYEEIKSGAMPLYGDKLLEEEIVAIREWIAKGAPRD
ncbi:MAG: hypothetical protein ACOVS5_03950 [Oligoflexus sp.]|jgi:hypothetical protein